MTRQLDKYEVPVMTHTSEVYRGSVIIRAKSPKHALALFEAKGKNAGEYDLGSSFHAEEDGVFLNEEKAVELVTEQSP